MCGELAVCEGSMLLWLALQLSARMLYNKRSHEFASVRSVIGHESSTAGSDGPTEHRGRRSRDPE